MKRRSVAHYSGGFSFGAHLGPGMCLFQVPDQQMLIP